MGHGKSLLIKANIFTIMLIFLYNCAKTPNQSAAVVKSYTSPDPSENKDVNTLYNIKASNNQCLSVFMSNETNSFGTCHKYNVSWYYASHPKRSDLFFVQSSAQVTAGKFLPSDFHASSPDRVKTILQKEIEGDDTLTNQSLWKFIEYKKQAVGFTLRFESYYYPGRCIDYEKTGEITGRVKLSECGSSPNQIFKICTVPETDSGKCQYGTKPSVTNSINNHMSQNFQAVELSWDDEGYGYEYHLEVYGNSGQTICDIGLGKVTRYRFDGMCKGSSIVHWGIKGFKLHYAIPGGWGDNTKRLDAYSALAEGQSSLQIPITERIPGTFPQNNEIMNNSASWPVRLSWDPGYEYHLDILRQLDGGGYETLCEVGADTLSTDSQYTFNGTCWKNNNKQQPLNLPRETVNGFRLHYAIPGQWGDTTRDKEEMALDPNQTDIFFNLDPIQ